jgi:ABC-2 type transport system permease protein
MTSSTTFQPTILQQLLGTNYKWWYCFMFGVKANTTYAIADALYFLAQLLYVAGFIFLYSKLGNTGIVHEIILTNIFVSFASFRICYQVDAAISSGNLTAMLIQPSSTFLHFFCYNLGLAVRGIILNLILFIIVLYYFSFSLDVTRFMMVIPVAAFFGLAIMYFSDLIIGLMTFWTTVGYGQISVYYSLYALTNASLISYTFLPNIVQYNPFAFVAYHPMQIYLGNYNTPKTLLVFLGGIGWCIILYLLAKWIFKLGLKRNEAVGL